MIELQGTVTEIVFHNSENGYVVARFHPEEGVPPTVIVGLLANCSAGQNLRVSGDYIVHPKFGRQFEVKDFEFLHPKTVEGIERFLSSGLIKGVGASTARDIVSVFGEKTLEIIEAYPQKLLRVQGIGKKKLELIKSSYEEHRAVKEVMVFLKSHDISTGRALKIYRQYGNDTVRLLSENPYRLCDEIGGIGFKTADEISQKLGLPADSPYRMKAALRFVLTGAEDDGHCFQPRGFLMSAAAKLIGADAKPLERCLHEMEKERVVYAENGRVYLPELFHAENRAAKQLRAISSRTEIPMSLPYLENVVAKIHSRLGFSLSEQQKQVMLTAMQFPVVVLTGGPGTGKTTVTKALTALFQLHGKKVRLCAPTGRAAKRLSEATGNEAVTIHRLLEYSPRQQIFLKNELSPLECDALIVDECSMLDIMLAAHLLTAVREGTSVVFVGDADQLPSVGAGNFFHDVIASGRFPVTRLTEIFRQKGKELLIENAYRINNGQFPKFSNKEFVFFEEEDNERCLEKISRLIKKLSEQYGLDPLWDICVLSPMHKGALGVSRLNQELKRAFNPEPVRSFGHFSIGDKVMQIKNNYEKQVFNGDVGIVETVYPGDGRMVVRFPDAALLYERADMDELVIAYAATVHKSQGSEFRCVVMPVVTSHYIMLSRNIFYTAVTRAKELVVLFGTKKAIFLALKNQREIIRHTALCEKLSQKGAPASERNAV